MGNMIKQSLLAIFMTMFIRGDEECICYDTHLVYSTIYTITKLLFNFNN